MISQIYLVEYGSYVGQVSTYEEALELEKRYKCYTEDCGPISITADEIREYRDKHKPTVLKSDFCLSSARTETVAKGVTRLYENGKHKATILGCEDLSAYHNAK